MTSIKDVAEAAGVSTATVSRVLADKPHVRPEIRDHVLSVVKKLNYRPNRVARSLRAQQSNTIGLIVSDIRNPFFTQVSRIIEDVAYENKICVYLCNADETPAKEAMYLQLMQDENVAGIILSPTRQTAEAFNEAVNLDIPIVVIDRQVQGAAVDTVVLDNVEAAYRLVSHLITHGYHRIGAMFGTGSTTGPARQKGYEQALQAHGLSFQSELVHHVHAKEEAGYNAVQKLLTLPHPPDAIFTSNSLLSAGAFRALQESDLSIPADIAFASFDETIWTSLVQPQITVIAQPTHEIGHTAIDLLLKRIAEPERATREVILKGQLIVRQSCGCNG